MKLFKLAFFTYWRTERAFPLASSSTRRPSLADFYCNSPLLSLLPGSSVSFSSFVVAPVN